MKTEKTGFKFLGRLEMQHWRDGKIINTHKFHNDVVNEGLNSVLDIMFGGVTQITHWYLGLIDNSGYTALAAADVMSSHTGWAEFILYSQATRPEWGAGAAASQQVTNATAMTFDITGSGTVKGGFLCSNATISGTTGTLWATALLATAQVVNNGDQLKLVYTIEAQRSA